MGILSEKECIRPVKPIYYPGPGRPRATSNTALASPVWGCFFSICAVPLSSCFPLFCPCPPDFCGLLLTFSPGGHTLEWGYELASVSFAPPPFRWRGSLIREGPGNVPGPSIAFVPPAVQPYGSLAFLFEPSALKSPAPRRWRASSAFCTSLCG